MLDKFNIAAIMSGVAACLIGLAYLQVANAPTNMIIINVGALSIGLLLAFLIRRFVRFTDGFVMMLAVLGSIGLLATATLGYTIEGASRWALIGPFFIQTSLILLPTIALCFARVQNLWTAGAVIIAALAMAMQPDRAMAGMLCLAVLVISLKRTTSLTIVASVCCLLALAITIFLPDRLPAVPYVDHILWTSFDISPTIGAMLWAGCFLMICPVMFVPKEKRTVLHYTFASCWFASIAAAALGAYPTPLVGYGSSAIIGYFLSLILVQSQTQADQDIHILPKDRGAVDMNDKMLRASTT